MRKNFSINQNGELCFFNTTVPTHISQYLAKVGGLKQSTPDRVKREYFIWAASIVHKNLDFSKCVYTHSHAPVTILCPIHGEFTSRASHILDGIGCKQCSADKLRKPIEQFIKEANLVHNNTYTYERAEYTTTHSKIKVTCSKHGDFSIVAKSHLYGVGCPVCYNEEAFFSTNVYLLKANTSKGILYKIGVSNSPERRALALTNSNGYGLVFKVERSFSIKNQTKALAIEKWAHNTLKHANTSEYINMDGGSELFYLSNTELLGLISTLDEISKSVLNKI